MFQGRQTNIARESRKRDRRRSQKNESATGRMITDSNWGGGRVGKIKKERKI